MFWRLSRWMNCWGGRPQDRVSGASPRLEQGSKKGAMGSKGANNGSSWKSTSVAPPNIFKPNFKFIGSSSLGIRFLFSSLNPQGNLNLSAIHKTGWIVINKELRCSPDLRIPKERPPPIGRRRGEEKKKWEIFQKDVSSHCGADVSAGLWQRVWHFSISSPGLYFTEMQSLFGEAYFNILWSHSIPLEVTCPYPIRHLL